MGTLDGVSRFGRGGRKCGRLVGSEDFRGGERNLCLIWWLGGW